MLKIKNFMFGSDNKDRRTSHNDNLTDLTNEKTEKGKQKERGGDWEREGK